MSPPHTIKRIEQSHATSTTRETQTRMISAGVYDPDGSMMAPAADADCIKEKSMRDMLEI